MITVTPNFEPTRACNSCHRATYVRYGNRDNLLAPGQLSDVRVGNTITVLCPDCLLDLGIVVEARCVDLTPWIDADEPPAPIPAAPSDAALMRARGPLADAITAAQLRERLDGADLTEHVAILRRALWALDDIRDRLNGGEHVDLNEHCPCLACRHDREAYDREESDVH